jgi:hypothetical protein
MHEGLAFHVAPSDGSKEYLHVLQLSIEGSLHHHRYTSHTHIEPANPHRWDIYNGSNEAQKPYTKVATYHSALAKCEATEFNFHPAYTGAVAASVSILTRRLLAI